MLSLSRKPEQLVFDKLRPVPVFDGVSDRDLKYIQGMCHLRQYTEAEHVFREGDPGVGLFVLLEGEVEIYTHKPDYHEVFAQLKEGDFFGELALLVDLPRTASALSKQFSRVICFSRVDLGTVIARKPRLGNTILLNMARLIGLRLVMSNRELERLSRELGRPGTTVEGGKKVDPD